jgi:hypothetical protein
MNEENTKKLVENYENVLLEWKLVYESQVRISQQYRVLYMELKEAIQNIGKNEKINL